jgi:hypothetical protein
LGVERRQNVSSVWLLLALEKEMISSKECSQQYELMKIH